MIKRNYTHRKQIIVILLTVLHFVGFAQNYSKGLIKTDFDTNKIIFKHTPIVRDALPKSFSLKAYSPSPGNQGSFGSCTSWASAYCAFTIVKRIELGMGIQPFDPINLHNRLKSLESEMPCSDGNYVEQAASLLKSHGCPHLSYESCGSVLASKFYEKRMYDFEYVSIRTYDFKYVISQEKSPIVISVDSYENDWSSSGNHIDGVWNGVYGGADDGAHAMVIIGYDDTKAGGAFLVQNSWGTDWGSGGYFWIKYSDIGKVIYSATQFKPGSIINFNSSAAQEEIVTTEQVYRFYNDCSLTTYVSLSQNIGQDWITEGWYAISSGSFVDIPIADRSANTVYWMATASRDGKYFDWVDNANGTKMCFDRINVHKIYNNSSGNCPEVASYNKKIPESRSGVVVTTLTCSNIPSRGDSDGFVAESNTVEIDLNQLVNYKWEGETELIDAFNLRPIVSKLNQKNEEFYDVFYVKNGKVKNFQGGKIELMKLGCPVFSTKFNAESYIEATTGKN